MVRETVQGSRDIVKEVRGLLAKATPGPWMRISRAANMDEICGVIARGSIANVSRWVSGVTGSLEENVANAVLIARAPELIKALADEVERLRGLVRHMNFPRGD